MLLAKLFVRNKLDGRTNLNYCLKQFDFGNGRLLLKRLNELSNVKNKLFKRIDFFTNMPQSVQNKKFYLVSVRMGNQV